MYPYEVFALMASAAFGNANCYREWRLVEPLLHGTREMLKIIRTDQFKVKVTTHSRSLHARRTDQFEVLKGSYTLAIAARALTSCLVGHGARIPFWWQLAAAMSSSSISKKIIIIGSNCNWTLAARIFFKKCLSLDCTVDCFVAISAWTAHVIMMYVTLP